MGECEVREEEMEYEREKGRDGGGNKKDQEPENWEMGFISKSATN